MKLNKAIELIEYYQKWRRDNNVPSKYEHPNPTELGKAIDVILEDAKKFYLIRQWSKEKGIYENATSEKQFLKLAEEVGEIADAIGKNNREELIDGIGDAVVVLTILAQLNGLDIEDCINTAYNVISKRKGKMVNGIFVKSVNN